MMPEKIAELLLALIAGGAGTALIGIYRSRAQNRLDNSAGRVNDAKAWDTLITTLERRLITQEKSIETARQENAELEGYINKLQELMEAKNLDVPKFTHRKRKD